MSSTVKPGDWLVLLVASCAVIALADRFWFARGSAQSVIVRSGGQIVHALPLAQDARYRVQGQLGVSEIEVSAKRVRVAHDPSPKQYCVKQGWLSRPGEVALCLPNQISIQIAGAQLYDSLSF